MTLPEKPQNVQWSWSNYFKNNTPDTIQRIGKTIKLILGLFATGGVYATHIGKLDWWVPMLISSGIIVIDQGIELAGHAQSTIKQFEVTDESTGDSKTIIIEDTTPQPDADK